jgi:uncharacterized protein
MSEASEITEEQLRALAAAEDYAREALRSEGSGHDWRHIERVRNLARTIAREEGADRYICELAALLHDLADAKIAGDEAAGQRRVREWLVAHEVEPAIIEHVMEIIATMSFAGGNRPPMTTLEGRVVQDADRLDAIGAVGVARTFAYGGSRGRLLYDPNIPPQQHSSAEAYHASDAPTINHFYEKLLLLKDRMNTPYAQRLAEGRHAYMEAFLAEFYAEWDGER